MLMLYLYHTFKFLCTNIHFKNEKKVFEYRLVTVSIFPRGVGVFKIFLGTLTTRRTIQELSNSPCLCLGQAIRWRGAF